MFAIVETGGKQYRVQEGDVITVEKLNVEAGEKIVFDKVLMLSDGETAGMKAMIEIVRHSCDYARNALRSSGITVFKQGEFCITRGNATPSFEVKKSVLLWLSCSWIPHLM